MLADIAHEFFRGDFPLFTDECDRALPDAAQILRRIKGKAEDMGIIRHGIQQVAIKEYIQQIGLAAPANARDHFDHAVMHSEDQLVEVSVPLDFHLISLRTLEIR